MNTAQDWSFSFAHPWLLLLLLGIPVLAWLRGRRGGAPAVLFSSLAPLRQLGSQARSRAGGWLAGLLHAACVLLIIALARPQAGRTLSHIEASGIDIVLALDVSRSMLAEDFTIGSQRANRLEAVKQVTERFIQARKNDRIGLVAFSGRPYLVSPLTLDHDWLLKNLERVKIGMVEDGTAIGSAIVSASNRLKQKEAKSKVVILLTDGDNNSGKITPETAAEAAKALGIKVYAIGAGTRGFAPMPIYDNYNRLLYYQNVRVEFNEESLKQIAQTTDARYFRATNTRSLEQIFGEIDQLEKTTEELTQFKQFRDLFPWFLGPGLGLLALQMILSQTWWRRLP